MVYMVYTQRFYKLICLHCLQTVSCFSPIDGARHGIYGISLFKMFFVMVFGHFQSQIQGEIDSGFHMNDA